MPDFNQWSAAPLPLGTLLFSAPAMRARPVGAEDADVGAGDAAEMGAQAKVKVRAHDDAETAGPDNEAGDAPPAARKRRRRRKPRGAGGAGGAGGEGGSGASAPDAPHAG